MLPGKLGTLKSPKPEPTSVMLAHTEPMAVTEPIASGFCSIAASSADSTNQQSAPHTWAPSRTS